MQEDKDHSQDAQGDDSSEADMDNYMDRVGAESDIKIIDIKKLRNDDFLQAVKTFLREPNNKILDIYVKNLKKNMILGFLVKGEKMLTDGTSTRTKGGQFMALCKEFVYKTNKDEPISEKIRTILKKTNKNRNIIKSKKRKARKREQMQNMVVEKMRNLTVDNPLSQS